MSVYNLKSLVSNIMMTQREASDKYSIPYKLINERVRKGKTLEDSVKMGAYTPTKYYVEGKYLTVMEISKKYKMNTSTVKWRIRKRLEILAPIRKADTILFEGVEYPPCKLARKLNINLVTMLYRHKQGLSLDKGKYYYPSKIYPKEYRAWSSMKARCLKDRTYLKRAIKISKEINDCFEVFLAEVGLCPHADYSLDRIDNDKGYIKNNLRWASSETQANNRSDNNTGITLNGYMTYAEASRFYNISAQGLYRRRKLYKESLHISLIHYLGQDYGKSK